MVCESAFEMQSEMVSDLVFVKPYALGSEMEFQTVSD